MTIKTLTLAKITVFALIASVIAVLLSVFSLTKAGDTALSDEDFMAKVEEGIEAYIEKQIPKVSIDDDAMKGDKDAPVTIIEFSDFECFFCARFAKNTLPQIVSEYIDTGKVRFVYRDLPLDKHKNAKPAAIAAECAREQGGDEMYFEYHDKIFENQASLGAENFKQWAVDLGLEASQFNECLDSEKYSDEVNKDIADGQSYGVSGTPAFFINNRFVSGAQPFAVFKTVIDEELAK